MIKRMLDPNPMTRITIAGIKANDWFKHDYSTSSNCHDEDDAISIQDVRLCCLLSWFLYQVHCFDQSLVSLVIMIKVYEEEKTSDSPTVINAFQLIGMSLFLDLSGLFETEVTIPSFLRLLCIKTILCFTINVYIFMHWFRTCQRRR